MTLNVSGPDAGLVWHFGDPMREQRLLAAGRGAVELANRGVLTVTGRDRLAWLHSLTSQHLESLPPGQSCTALVLSPTGHVEHLLACMDDGVTFWVVTEGNRAPALADWLESMRFMLRVDVRDVSAERAVVWANGTPDGAVPLVAGAASPSMLAEATRSPVIAAPEGGCYVLVPRAQLEEALAGVHRAGTWAYEALRIAAGVPRVFVDTDERTIPNEIGLLGVHLDKGCYRGQETVARVHTLGRPPRRLVLLHLDGSADALPQHGDAVQLDGRTVGSVGSAARHYELGPIALALVKRNTPPDATLAVLGEPYGTLAAAQEAIVDPDVGLHVRPRL